MTNRTIRIAPVKKCITVNAPQAHAFDVFTKGIDRWWPKTHGIGEGAVKRSIIEPFTGGRWYAEYENGNDVVNGHVLAWEPPARVVFSWEISAAWKPDSKVASEIEVNFIAEDANVTRVELEHRNFEALGEEGGKKMRGDVDGGWPGLMDLFKKAAEG